jgi:hypothetical protein
MSEYWTPSSDYFSVSNSPPQLLVSASNQIEGLARIVNIGTTVGYVAMLTASATIDTANLAPIEAQGTLFVAFGFPATRIVATGATCLAQAGYALK